MSFDLFQAVLGLVIIYCATDLLQIQMQCWDTQPITSRASGCGSNCSSLLSARLCQNLTRAASLIVGLIMCIGLPVSLLCAQLSHHTGEVNEAQRLRVHCRGRQRATCGMIKIRRIYVNFITQHLLYALTILEGGKDKNQTIMNYRTYIGYDLNLD